MYAAYCMRNLAISAPLRQQLFACGAVELLVSMLTMAVPKAGEEVAMQEEACGSR